MKNKRSTGQLSSWGENDQIGAANSVDALATLKAVRLVRQGTVFDLAQPISTDSPRMDLMSPYSMCMWSHPLVSQRGMEAEGALNGAGFADERVEMDLHTGTHIDALGHCWIGDSGYNAKRMLEVVGNWGLIELGIENVPPLIARGVLLDIARLKGRRLGAGEVIAVSDLSHALEAASLEIGAGDIVLIRTGWGEYYGSQNAMYVDKAPGLGLDAARWLADRGVAVIGSDTMALEVLPAEDPSAPWVVHQHLLAARGVYILENADLQAISDAGHHEFMCACLPLKFRGGTASPVRLTAVV